MSSCVSLSLPKQAPGKAPTPNIKKSLTNRQDTVDKNTSNAKVYSYTILLGVEVGSYCQFGFPVAQIKAGHKVAYAVGFITVAQMLGIALGTGMSGAIFVNTAEQGMRVLFPLALDTKISAAIAGVGSNLILSAGPLIQAKAVHIIAKSVELAFLPVIAGGALAFLGSLTMKWEKLFG